MEWNIIGIDKKEVKGNFGRLFTGVVEQMSDCIVEKGQGREYRCAS